MPGPVLGTEIQQETKQTKIPACSELNPMEGRPKKTENQINFMHDGDNFYGENLKRKGEK